MPRPVEDIFEDALKRIRRMRFEELVAIWKVRGLSGHPYTHDILKETDRALVILEDHLKVVRIDYLTELAKETDQA